MASFSWSAASWFASVFPQHTNHASLNPDVARRFDNRPHLGVGRLQTDFPGTLAIKPFERRFFSPDQRNHDISGVGYLRLLAHHKVAVQDVVFDHRTALDLQDKRVSAASEVSERN